MCEREYLCSLFLSHTLTVRSMWIELITRYTENVCQALIKFPRIFVICPSVHHQAVLPAFRSMFIIDEFVCLFVVILVFLFLPQTIFYYPKMCDVKISVVKFKTSIFMAFYDGIFLFERKPHILIIFYVKQRLQKSSIIKIRAE